MINNIKGVGVALITPFDSSNAVDYKALERLVDDVIDNGVDYLVALGTTAETPTLTCVEKNQIVACIKERNKGRLPIVMGMGDYNTAGLVEKIEDTDFSGISALLSVTPYYNRPSQEGLFQHYKAVAETSPVPVILYNVPSRTGQNMTAETTLRIAHEVDNVMGIKEAAGMISQMAKIINGRPKGFKVISGDDMMSVPLAAIGGDGVISVAANAFPKAFSKMVHAAYDGDKEESIKLFYSLVDAMNALFEEGNPTGVKTALAVKGKIESVLRLPLVSGSEKLFEKLETIIKKHNI